MEKVIFKEEQKFKFIFKAAILIFSIAVVAAIFRGTYIQFTSGESFGNNPIENEHLIYLNLLTVLILGLLTLLFFMAKLELTITKSEIKYKYFPFVRNWKTLTKHNLNEAYVRKYKPIWEYGGWGYRSNFKNGKALNISGNMGLQLVLNDNKKILIGTKKPKALETAIKEFLKPREIE